MSAWHQDDPALGIWRRSSKLISTIKDSTEDVEQKSPAHAGRQRHASPDLRSPVLVAVADGDSASQTYRDN